MSGYYWYRDNPNCGRCGHLNGRGFCNMTACIYPVLPQTAVMTEHRLTHADRTRSMTDEELAEWAWSVESDGRAYGPRGKKAWLDWLKQEAE